MKYCLWTLLLLAGFTGYGQHCVSKDMTPALGFEYEPKFAKMDISWYDVWLEYT